MPKKAKPREERLIEFIPETVTPAKPRPAPFLPSLPKTPRRFALKAKPVPLEPVPAKSSRPKSSKDYSEADDEDWSDEGGAMPEEKTDITRLSETLLNTTDMRGKTNVNDAQIRCILAIDILAERYPFLRIKEDFTVPLMHLLTSRAGWSRTGLQETLKGVIQRAANDPTNQSTERHPGF